ncbi:MAG: hypothetical protein WC477_06635 [Patescibacteria group bacterium]
MAAKKSTNTKVKSPFRRKPDRKSLHLFRRFMGFYPEENEMWRVFSRRPDLREVMIACCCENLPAVRYQNILIQVLQKHPKSLNFILSKLSYDKLLQGDMFFYRTLSLIQVNYVYMGRWMLSQSQVSLDHITFLMRFGELREEAWEALMRRSEEMELRSSDLEEAVKFDDLRDRAADWLFDLPQASFRWYRTAFARLACLNHATSERAAKMVVCTLRDSTPADLIRIAEKFPSLSARIHNRLLREHGRDKIAMAYVLGHSPRRDQRVLASDALINIEGSKPPSDRDPIILEAIRERFPTLKSVKQLIKECVPPVDMKSVLLDQLLHPA